MRIRELRKEAREAAKGSKMKLVMPVFLFTSIIYLLGALPSWMDNEKTQLIVALISLVLIIIFGVAASYAIIIRMLQVARKEETSNFFSDIFGEGMKNGWACAWGIFKKIWPWVLAIVIGYVLFFVGTISAFSFSGVHITDGVVESTTPTLLANVMPILAIIGLILIIVSAIKVTIASYRYFIVTYLKHDYPDRSVNELLEKSDEMMMGNKAKAFVIPFTFIGWLLLAAIIGAVISVGFNLIWPPYSLLGETISTMPVWAAILMNIIAYFVISFVTAYMQLTFCEFYLERNPLSIYAEDYVKPETNEKKYKGIVTVIVVLMVLICFVAPTFIGGYTTYQTKQITEDAQKNIDSIMVSLINSSINQYAGESVRGTQVKSLVDLIKSQNDSDTIPSIQIKYGDRIVSKGNEEEVNEMIVSTQKYSITPSDTNSDGCYDLIEIKDN